MTNLPIAVQSRRLNRTYILEREENYQKSDLSYTGPLIWIHYDLSGFVDD